MYQSRIIFMCVRAMIIWSEFFVNTSNQLIWWDFFIRINTQRQQQIGACVDMKVSINIYKNCFFLLLISLMRWHKNNIVNENRKGCEYVSVSWNKWMNRWTMGANNYFNGSSKLDVVLSLSLARALQICERVFYVCVCVCSSGFLLLLLLFLADYYTLITLARHYVTAWGPQRTDSFAVPTNFCATYTTHAKT